MLKRPHVAVSPDKRLFVRDRGFEGIAFWRLESDRSEPEVVADLFRSTLGGLGFDARGRLVAVTRTGELRAWNVANIADWEPAPDSESAPEPEELWRLSLPLRGVVATAFSDDGRWLAIGDETGALALVDLSGGEPIVAQRQAHELHVVALAFDRTGARLASSGRDRTIRFWSTTLTEAAPAAAPTQGESAGPSTGPSGENGDASPDAASPEAASPEAASPDAVSLDAASPDAVSLDAASPEAADSQVTEDEVMEFFSDSNEAPREQSVDEGAAPKVEAAPKEPSGASAVKQGSPGLTFPELYHAVETEGWAICLAWDASGHRLAVGAMDNGLYLFDVGEVTELSAVRFVHLGWVADVEWSPADDLLVTASWDTTVGIFDAAELTAQVAFEIHQDYVVDVTFVPGTDLVISASYDRTAVVWNLRERKAVAQLKGHSDWVDFALPLDDDRLVTVCSDGTNRIWRTEDWTVEAVLGVSVSAGIEVGAPVDLSDYVDTSGLASYALDATRNESLEPVTRYRDMSASNFGVGSGQTAMALLTSALDSAPDIADFATSAPASDVAASFDPPMPEIDLPEPSTSSQDPDPLAHITVDGGDTEDAAAAFQARDLASEAADLPSLDVADPEVNLPETNLSETNLPEVNLPESNLPESNLGDASLPDVDLPDVNLPEPKLAAAELPAANLPDSSLGDGSLSDASLSDADLPDVNLPESKLAAAELPAANLPDSSLGDGRLPDASLSDVDLPDVNLPEANLPDASLPDVDLPDVNLPEANRPEAKAPVAKAPVADPAEPVNETAADPATLEMTPAMLGELDDDGPGTMRSSTSPVESDSHQVPGRSRATTIGGAPTSEGSETPEVDANWDRLESDLVTGETPSHVTTEPALDQTGATHPTGARSQTDPGQVPSREKLSTEHGRPALPEEEFSPAFIEASESDDDDEGDEFDDLGKEGTVGYASLQGEDSAGTDAPEGISTAPSHPRVTQELPGAPGRPGPDDPDAAKRARRHRAKTAAGADLSEESTFRFFFDGDAPSPTDDQPDADDEAQASTSRLVPDRNFTPFGAPEVFDTSVSEIWTARPERSEAKMGILKKPRTEKREYQPAYAIRTYHQWVYSVAIAPDGESIASCGGNDLVCVWSRVGDLLHQLRAPSSGFNEVKFTPDGTVVVAAGDDGGIHMWMLPQGEYGRIRHAVLEGHDAVVTAVAFTPDGRYMLSGSYDGTARVWDMTDGECRVVLDDHDGPISDVAIAGRRAYTVGHDGTVRIWDDRKWLAVDVFDGFDKLLGVSSNGVIHAWTAANGDAFVAEDARAQGLLQHRGEARGVCVTESGMVITAGQDSQIRIYQRGQTVPSQSLSADASLWSLDVTDGYIAAGGDDGRIHIFRT